MSHGRLRLCNTSAIDSLTLPTCVTLSLSWTRDYLMFWHDEDRGVRRVLTLHFPYKRISRNKNNVVVQNQLCCVLLTFLLGTKVPRMMNFRISTFFTYVSLIFLSRDSGYYGIQRLIWKVWMSIARVLHFTQIQLQCHSSNRKRKWL